MEYVIIIICGLILAETTLLVLRGHKPVRSGRRKIFVDTSVLIDGRILSVARTGFIDSELVILKSVLRELQLLADNKDSERRSRGRAGLENAAELERVIEADTEVMDDGMPGMKVDELLLMKAREFGGAVLTLDYNLAKIAEAENVEILNLNDLSLALKTEFATGKRVKLRITDKGSGKGQGVGHLNDGVMVVVEHASKKVGKEITVELERLRETSAGRIAFAKIIKG